jgi:basic membrane lipoprotein Med (substrate-binding protein (PBP1-ABC) superfamily)
LNSRLRIGYKRPMRHALRHTVFAAIGFLALGVAACPSQNKEAAAPASASGLSVGLVTDVGGRGDQSFNDGALRGLEAWTCGPCSLSQA